MTSVSDAVCERLRDRGSEPSHDCDGWCLKRGHSSRHEASTIVYTDRDTRQRVRSADCAVYKQNGQVRLPVSRLLPCAWSGARRARRVPQGARARLLGRG